MADQTVPQLQIPLELQDFINSLAAQRNQVMDALANADAKVIGIARQLDFAQARIKELEALLPSTKED